MSDQYESSIRNVNHKGKGERTKKEAGRELQMK